MSDLVISGFPGGSVHKESVCIVGDLGLIVGLGRSPGGGHGNPLQYSCLENPHGQRSLVGYSPWGCKELDMTEQLARGTHIVSCSVTQERWHLSKIVCSLYYFFVPREGGCPDLEIKDQPTHYIVLLKMRNCSSVTRELVRLEKSWAPPQTY